VSHVGLKKYERRAIHTHMCAVMRVGSGGLTKTCGASEAFVAQNSCSGSRFAMYKRDKGEGQTK
jgi:hypothetical protein